MEVTPENIKERITKLEAFVKEQKSWKEAADNANKIINKITSEKESVEKENSRLIQENAAFNKLKEALRDLLGAVPAANGTTGTINITHTPTTYNVIHNGETIIDISTKTQEGRLLYCAIVDLHREPFTTNEITAKLIERGWNMPAAVFLSRLRKDGKLVKTANGYRLPEMAKFLIDGKEVET